MRQEVPYSQHKHGSTSAKLLASALLVLACAGCQFTQPRTQSKLSPFDSSANASLKPAEDREATDLEYVADKPAKQSSEESPTTTTEDDGTQGYVLPASATIRGQTGYGWNPATTTLPSNSDPNLYDPNNLNNNRYQPQSGRTVPIPPPTTGIGNNTVPPTTVLQPPVPNPGGYTQQPGSVYGAAPGYLPPQYPATGYDSQPAYGNQGYGATLAPGLSQTLPNEQSTLAPGAYGLSDPYAPITAPPINVPGQYQPNVRVTPLDVYVQEGRTGRVVFGGSVNSDLGVAGQIVIDERNFDIWGVPRSWDDVWSGRAFRGRGQNFRLELMPGNRVERYTANWSTRNLFDYLPYSLSVSGFYYTRQYPDWTEQRIGGRVALGYEVTKDLSVSSEIRLEDVKLFSPRIAGVQELDAALGSNDLYTARFRIAHDTRDSPFLATQGGLFEMVYDQVFGEYDYPRGQVNYSRYFLLKERPDQGGRHVLASTWRVGVSGSQTPIFENYFAGGYSTLRGFSFRGASPVDTGVQVGGEFMFLGSLEYVFPLTADEMLRGVAFVDYGTVERDIEINSENFRVAPGLGLRVSVPALGPAPLAFDFAVPVAYADNDDRQIFSFFMGVTR